MFKTQYFLCLDLDIRGLPLNTAKGLVDQDARVGQGISFTSSTGCQQYRAHGRGLPDADRCDIGLDILHGVIHRQTGCHGSARGIDIEIDILVRIFGF